MAKQTMDVIQRKYKKKKYKLQNSTWNTQPNERNGKETPEGRTHLYNLVINLDLSVPVGGAPHVDRLDEDARQLLCGKGEGTGVRGAACVITNQSVVMSRRICAREIGEEKK